jgi:hypothetical protein
METVPIGVREYRTSFARLSVFANASDPSASPLSTIDNVRFQGKKVYSTV